MDASFCELLATQTGAVVVSTSYRYSPRYPFPAAIDDVDAFIAHLQRVAATEFGADPTLLTTSGVSAGGNLALATCLADGAHGDAETAIKATVTYCASIDLRISPAKKPKPKGFPSVDPLFFLVPLFDSYPQPVRDADKAQLENARMSPIVAKVEMLPPRILMVIPTIDILLHEQLTFVERVKGEMAANERYKGRRLETKLYEGQLHGWVGCESFSH